MSAVKLEEQLKLVANSYLDKNLFSHYYFEAGFLDQSQAIVRLSNSGQQLFDLSSLTKALITTPLILKDLNESQLAIDCSLQQWVSNVDLKEFLHADLCGLRLSKIMAHQSGLPAWRNFYVDCVDQGPANRSQRLRQVFDRLKFSKTAKSTDCYSDVGMLLLGYLLELKTKKTWTQLVHELYVNHLDAEDLLEKINYAPQLASTSKFISSGYCQLRQKQLLGEVHDENCAALDGVSAHAGLFSSGESLGVFLKKLLNSKLGQQLIEINSALIKPENPSLFGWRQGNDYSSEVFGDGLAMGHLGFTGTAFWLCPQQKKYAIALCNRTLNQRLDARIRDFRRRSFQVLDQITPS